MASKIIHIAIGSTASMPGQVAENLAGIDAFARRAGQDGADILLTPELSACGYGPYPEVLATAETAGDGPIYRALAHSAKENDVVVCAGFVEAAGSKKHLAHYAVFPDGKFVVQRKHRVTLAERPLDPGVELDPPDYVNNPPLDPADPGQPLRLDFQTFTVKGVICAITICADGGITNVAQKLAADGVELILNPAGAGGTRADRVTTAELATPEGREIYLKWLEMVCYPAGLVRSALENRVAYAAVNLAKYDGQKQYHLGHGTIVTPMGEVPAIIHGIPNLDRQRPMYTHAAVDVADRLP